MLIASFQILLSINLAAFSILSYNYLISQKEVVFQSYYNQEQVENINRIEQINNALFPILEDISFDPEFRIYRYTDTLNCPIEMNQNECHVETCNLRNVEGEDSIMTVDLKYMGEKYTGQQGQSIWLNIYEELGKNSTSEMHNHFINLIKGLHSSISVSITEQFDYGNKTGANVDFFFWRVGDYPDRIYNLYFLESFLIQASKFLQINQIELPHLTQLKVQGLLSSYNLMPLYKFDYFQNLTKKDLEQYKNDIKLLDSYMDCVHCKRCKVNGKLQIHGLETSIELLFHDDKGAYFEKNDVTAFLNTFQKISSSVKSIESMFERRKQTQYHYFKLSGFGFLFLLFLSQVVVLLKR
ncbi:unnamed protein product (macronuclear) [Paramecium tetraurelia]|uniref:Endoplasmic reticulum oxidoreductin n=1 Tax=Paramecium tetraurelia TaxID=5888 RepID=A0BCB3_PARTE|nr:uncharacterized protein GSPATT00004274001 [Paramecium tetraurelia]CAK56180.1 unnamed protein product [Paramecium tetraurelia]|eukprot:XP_001423578.1 hypothetical protein (macronuclear) [Paramecium tetraurelia strain d4-2]